MSDRIQTEALQAQALRYKTLMETSRDSIYVMDEKGDLQEANMAFLRRRGYTAEEAKALNVADWNAQWSRGQLEERMRELVGSSAVFETRHRGKDGSVFDVEVWATSFRIDGEALFFCVTRDITERRQTEQALRESEERFREVAENIDAVVWLCDPQHQEVFYVSPAYERIWGRTRASLCASIRSWTEALHPEDRDRILALRAADHFEEMPDMTYRIVRPDGSLRWIYSREFPVKDADGNIVRVAGIVEDITERKCVELALHERLRFETLLTELSAAFAKLPTRAVDQEIDKWLQKIVEFLDVDRATFDQAGEDGMTLSRSHSHTARGIDTLPLNVMDDQTPWITKQLLRGNTVKWSRIPDEMPEQASREKEFVSRIGAKSVLSIPVCIGGSVICAISFTSMRICRDWPDEMVVRLRLVGEVFANAIARKRAEERLFQREAELDEAQRLASIGRWEWDIPAGGLTYSDELRRIYGFEGEDRRSPHSAFSEAVHPDDRARRSAAINTALAGGRPYDVEFRIIRPDKSIRFVHSRGRLTSDETGQPVRMIGMAQDITERKRAAKELEEANHQLRFLSRRRIQVQEDERRRLSRELHDQIGQLLTAGNINLQSARRTKDRRAISAKLDETIAIIEQILKQVRQISFDIRPPVLDDLGLAPAMRWMLNDTVARAGLTAEFLADPDLKRGDVESETACYRVGLEAVTNVVRHAQARKIWLELRNAGDALRLRIWDDGIGFDSVEAERRVRRDRLGLVGMRERATAVGGQFECKSAPGHGTEVRALFPISSERNQIVPL
jgi:PAS domain S-box-containing protein